MLIQNYFNFKDLEIREIFTQKLFNKKKRGKFPAFFKRLILIF